MNLEAEIKSLKRDIRLLKAERLKETWVSVSIITRLTGWKGRYMSKAREQGLVKYRKNSRGGYDYVLESVPPVFIKST